jgi:hypothetical protein
MTPAIQPRLTTLQLSSLRLCGAMRICPPPALVTITVSSSRSAILRATASASSSVEAPRSLQARVACGWRPSMEKPHGQVQREQARRRHGRGADHSQCEHAHHPRLVLGFRSSHHFAATPHANFGNMRNTSNFMILVPCLKSLHHPLRTRAVRASRIGASFTSIAAAKHPWRGSSQAPCRLRR